MKSAASERGLAMHTLEAEDLRSSTIRLKGLEKDTLQTGLLTHSLLEILPKNAF